MSFAELHKPGFVLPNAWDHASAAALAEGGFEAVGTTSLGVAAALGLSDGAAETAEATIDLARRLTHLPVHISMDIENGFSHDPAEVAAYVDRLGPVAGVNLEDQLTDPQHFAQVLVGVTGHGTFINARIDTYWLGDGGVKETLERAEHYVHAGADGIFVPGVRDEREIAALVEALPVPLNVLFLPGLTVPRLAELGVARISTGSLLYRAALGQALRVAAEIQDGRSDFEAPPYAAVNALAT
ncbi:isocitrate lyase/PEP mutase family protein [Solirubrobacter soli]|uniref:isocitrate lyase/PEP mutase family protein n=1 Tax=Solirubrobacter soli TaxID=363832 RepID=UPI000412C71D|nr:isocitrate lyase/phosphoenolpyruvate mutase family protein [Solirubrobacter soli]